MSFKEVFNLETVGMLSQIALLIFLCVFVAVTIRVMTRSSKEMKAASRIPLEDAPNQEQN